ncbi:hypothetical protein ARMSODRAFT_1026851 [Armillaria solidipes]|uniref:Uncharacterized protein n=1 Tax=Armillaria solidipes TaxID=1076256 RepID=A0A2H3AR15_9AGAR|nr:hypothetical protein ARMSODRAFT_1026851 [Armillaria solidipes]
MKDQRTASPWRTISPSPEDPRYQGPEETRSFKPAFSEIGTEPNGPPQPGTEYTTYVPEPRERRGPSSMPYSPSLWQRETVPTWTEPSEEDFDTFNQDEETFGWVDNDYFEETYDDYPEYNPT